MLSKTLPFGDASKFIFRDKEWFKDADIDIVSDGVYAIHTDIKKVAMQRGEAIKYDKLLIATGGNPRKLDIAGSDANHIYYLRSAADQAKIKDRASEIKDGVVVIGGGFIGQESAASLALKYKNEFQVHMVSSMENPMEKVFGKEVGEMLTWKNNEYKVKMHMKKKVTEIVKN